MSRNDDDRPRGRDTGALGVALLVAAVAIAAILVLAW